MGWEYTCKTNFKITEKNARIISNSEYPAHSEPLFKTLNLPKIEDLCKLKLMKLYYNLLYNLLPSYFTYYLEVINNLHASMTFDR